MTKAQLRKQIKQVKKDLATVTKQKNRAAIAVFTKGLAHLEFLLKTYDAV